MQTKEAKASVVFPAPGTEKVAPAGTAASLPTLRNCSLERSRENPIPDSLVFRSSGAIETEFFAAA